MMGVPLLPSRGPNVRERAPMNRPHHEVTIPPRDDTAVKAWRKAVTGLDPTVKGAFGLIGPWLDTGATYLLPAGTLVAGGDNGEDFRSRLWLVTDTGDLRELRDSRFKAQKSAWSASMMGTVRRHLDANPPAEILKTAGPIVVKAAPPPPPEANRYDGRCDFCGRPVAAEKGLRIAAAGNRWATVHALTAEGCPEPEPATAVAPAAPPAATPTPPPVAPEPATAPAGPPTWTVSYGDPGPRHPAPRGGYDIGQVGRWEVYEPANRLVPTTCPGYTRLGPRRVSAILTVVSVEKPVYCYDEDGNNPGDLVGEDGWYFKAQARVATDSEAADILAAEAVRRRRAELAADRDRLLEWRFRPQDDAVRPARFELDDDEFRRVPVGPDRAGRRWPDDELWVSQDRIVTLSYNGSDGDDWSLNNYDGRYVAAVHPLTPERAELVARLRAEYETDEAARSGRIAVDAARVLLEAGWTIDDIRDRVPAVRLDTAEDGRALLAAMAVWTDREWTFPAVCPSQQWTRFAVAEAEALVRAGMSYADAASRYVSGHTTAEAILAARPPAIDPAATRVLIKPLHAGGEMAVFGDAQAAGAWLAKRPQCWRQDLVDAAVGPRCLHVHKDGRWSLWDDGSLVGRSHWPQLIRIPGLVEPAFEAPASLTEAAQEALTLVVKGGQDSPVRARQVWHPLREAVTHKRTAEGEREGDGWSRELYRHTFTLPDGSQVTWWEVRAGYGGATGGGDYDWTETVTVWTDHTDASREYSRR